jgi:hypothetical protein
MLLSSFIKTRHHTEKKVDEGGEGLDYKKGGIGGIET